MTLHTLPKWCVMKKFQVRNFPDDAYFALEQLANENQRSVEGEARYALLKWIAPPEQVYSGEELYRQAVSGRLNTVLRKTNQFRNYKPLVPSNVAVELGIEDLGLVANWFSGDVLPSFTELQRLSKLFGCRADWLIHGEGDVYEWDSGVRMHGAGRAAVKHLLRPDSDGNKVTDIRLLREDSDTGALLIIREFENTRYVDAFWTNLHVSEAIGAGGESDLADFFVTLRALYKSFVKLDINVKGYLMPRSAYKQIREEEQAYPLMLLKDYRVNESMWWEDIWDKSQRGKFNYWKGDEALIRRIEDAIKRDKKLLDEIEAIKNPDPLDYDE
ncbi:hypothetical protein OC150_004257 [Salmonella enterica]|nr:hypothetical protein [Salmonella enterica]EJW8982045.1 hypothetical protein [Salmonella enterica]